VKVVKGKYKNTPLFVPPHTRVPSLRVKKSLFDMVGEYIEKSEILDLFSGSGSLGIEALSLGAKKVFFVDIRKKAVQFTLKNLSLIKALSYAEVFLKDVFKAIKDFFAQKYKFDVIFLDPPYYKGISLKTLQTLDEYDILAPQGLIVVLCYYKERMREEFSHFIIFKEKFYGDTQLKIYSRKDEKGGLSRYI